MSNIFQQGTIMQVIPVVADERPDSLYFGRGTVVKVLPVNPDGTPAMGGVTSVNGQTGAVVIPPSILTTGLFAEYRLDEGSGFQIANSQGGNRPTVNLLAYPEGGFSKQVAWPSGYTLATDHYAGNGFGNTNPFGGDVSRWHSPTGDFLTQNVPPADLPTGAMTLSFYVKSNTGVAQSFRQFVNNAFTANIAVPATGWTRIISTFTITQGTGINLITNDAAGDPLDLQIYGAQLEVGSVATAYIPGSGNLTFFGSPAWNTAGVDFSGNSGNNFAQTIVPYTPAAQVTLYCAVKWPAANTMSGGVGLFGTGYGAPAIWLAAEDQVPGGSSPNFNFNGTYSAASPVWVSPANLRDDNWHIVTGQYDGTTVRMLIDDVEVSSNAATIAPTTISQISLASLANGFSFPGTIGYASLYTVAHTPAQMAQQRAAIRAIMAAKGVTIPPILPQAIVFEGDSITNGSTGGSFVQVAMNALTPVVQARNFAVPGNVLPDLVGRGPKVDTMFNPARRNVLCVLIGRNDFGNYTDGGVYFAAVKTYLLARKAATPGLKIVLSTLFPSSQTGYNAWRNAFNAAARADTSGVIDAIADFAANTTIGSDAAGSNTTYFPDGTHPSNACAAIAGPIEQAAIQAVLNS